MHESPTFSRYAAALSAFIFSASQIFLLAIYPLLAETLGVSLSSLIAVFALGSLCFVVGSPYWAHQSDLRGRKKILSIGMFALSASLLTLLLLCLHPFSDVRWNLFFLLLSRIFYGLVASGIVPVAQSVQADWSDDLAPVKAMTFHSLSLSLGRLVGAALAVGFYQNFLAVFAGYLVIILLLIIAKNLFMQDRIPPASQAPAGASWTTDLISMKWLVGIAFVFTCFMETLNSALGGTIQNLLGLTGLSASGITAQILLVASAGILLIQILTRVFLKTASKAGLVFGALCLLSGALVLLRSESMPGLYASMTLIIVGLGILPPLYLSFLRSSTRQNNYGRRAGLIGSIHTLGYAFGGFAAALTLRFESPIAVSLSLIAVVLTALCWKQSTRLGFAAQPEAS